MHTRTLGENLEVSALGLGCMGMSFGLGKPADKDEMVKLIRHATTALAGADSVSLKGQLIRPARGRKDEDGRPVPTFRTNRADITD